MSWRTIVVTGIAKLDFQLEFMIIRKQESITKVHIDELVTVIIESTTVSMTAVLLCELVKKKVKVIFCDEKHNPCSELVSYYGSFDTSSKIKRQVKWDSYIKETAWSEIVSEKIRQQMLHLKERKLDVQADMLKTYVSQVQLGDGTNREGHAAKVYFNALFGMDFTRTADTSVNAALNYGYGILLSHFNREIVSNGYITQLGLFHDNIFNQFNLASDLMEPFRVMVDRCVFDMMPEKFDKEEKHEIIGIMNEPVMIDGMVQYMTNAITVYCRSVFDALEERDISLIKFYRYEF